MKPADAIALTAVIVAGLAILVGAAVQVSLAAIDAGRDRRRRRYEELLHLYSETGEAMSAFTNMAAAGLAIGGRQSRRSLVARFQREEDKAPEARRIRHLGRALRLHDADLRVWAAYQDWLEYSDHGSGELARGSKALTPTQYIDQLDGLLRWFYKVAGDDARSELKLWPRIAKSRAARSRLREFRDADADAEDAPEWPSDGQVPNGGR